MDEAKMVGDKAFVLEREPDSYAAFLGAPTIERPPFLGGKIKGPIQGWIIRGGGPKFFPRTTERKQTEAEAWADRAAVLRCAAARASLEAQPLVTGDGGKEQRLVDAINWACGCGASDFKPPECAPRYWWRSELTRRAGLVYDGKRYILCVQSESHPVEPQEAQPEVDYVEIKPAYIDCCRGAAPLHECYINCGGTKPATHDGDRKEP